MSEEVEKPPKETVVVCGVDPEVPKMTVPRDMVQDQQGERLEEEIHDVGEEAEQSMEGSCIKGHDNMKRGKSNSKGKVDAARIGQTKSGKEKK